MPTAFVLTPGHYGDGPQLEWVLEQVSVPRTGVGRPRTRPGHVLADKAYTSRRNRLYLRRRGIRHTIPERLDQRRKGTGVPAKRRVPRCIQFVLAPELLRIRRIASTTNEAEPTAKMLASTVSCWMARATTRVAVTVAATTSAVNARRCLALSVGCLNTGVSRWSGDGNVAGPKACHARDDGRALASSHRVSGDTNPKYQRYPMTAAMAYFQGPGDPFDVLGPADESDGAADAAWLPSGSPTC